METRDRINQCLSQSIKQLHSISLLLEEDQLALQSITDPTVAAQVFTVTMSAVVQEITQFSLWISKEVSGVSGSPEKPATSITRSEDWEVTGEP